MTARLVPDCPRVTARAMRTGCCWAWLLLLVTTRSSFTEAPFFAEGLKVGEVTSNSAVVWTRLSTIDNYTEDFQLPGASGEVRLIYTPDKSAARPTRTDWVPVDPENDFTHQFHLSELESGTTYKLVLDARGGGDTRTIAGSFRTAPAASDPARVRFTVTTGHKFKTIDQPGKGQQIYPSMARLDPDFFVHTGDIVYYDNDTPPKAESVELARLHWHRMYGLLNQRVFHRHIASYFIKDDHDTLKNDCWPGQTFGELTFAQGQDIFREQVPTSDSPYRTIRWGRDLQVWLMEGRDFRSPNTMPDGPDKTIWGADQKAWLRHTVSDSDATFRIVISATPIVGPDRDSKRDNHANAAFAHEGREVRSFLSQRDNLIVVCGDRHWQYASVDPHTGLQEFSCGPSTDKHAGGWKPADFRGDYHRYLNVAGGFLSVTVEPSAETTQLLVRFHDTQGKVLHERHLSPVKP